MKHWWIIPVCLVAAPTFVYVVLRVARWFFLTTSADLPPVLPF